MSRIGKKPVTIPQGVKVNISNSLMFIEGPKGKLQFDLPKGIKVEVKDSLLNVSRQSDTKPVRSLHGLTRSLAVNMIKGVTDGYSKDLEIVGTGFKAQIQGANLVLNLSYSHPVNFPIPEGIKILTPKPNQIAISGIDKMKVGDTAAKIRSVFPPEPYKGKGIRYAGEYVKKKIGKAATK